MVVVGLQLPPLDDLAPNHAHPLRNWRRKKGAVRSKPSVSGVIKKEEIVLTALIDLAPNRNAPRLQPKPRASGCWRREKSAVRTDRSAAKPPVPVVITISSDDEDEEDDHYPRTKKMRSVAVQSVVHIPSDNPWPNPTTAAKIIEENPTLKQTADSSAAEYAVDILHNLRSMECETKMKRWPLAKDNDDRTVLPIRAALVDWLVAVAKHYGLHSDTLFLACSYFDRFISSNAIDPDELKLLSVSCMLLATKYEEKRPSLAVQDLHCFLTTDGYCTNTKEQVLKMETRVVKSLHYQMASPTVNSFVNSFLATSGVHLGLDVEQTHYLAELSLLDHGCNRFLPSLVSASAVFLSRFTLHPEIHPWTSTLQRHTGYTPSDLKDCICAIHDLQTSIKCSTLMAIRDKYQIVAMLFPPLPIIPAAYLE